MRSRPLLVILLLAALTLTSAAWLRSAEYDEQYTLFVTAGHARPAWPTDAFTAGEVQTLQSGVAGFTAIAHDLRAGDVHPPLYFWTVSTWREVAGHGLFAARLASVLCSLVALCAVAAIARLAAIPAWLAVLMTLGCYGFVYTGTIARGFALAQMLTMGGVALLLLAERHRRGSLALMAGMALGAATFTNYLAVLVGLAALLWLARPFAAPGRRRTRKPLTPLAWAGFAVWLPADLWFLVAQRQARSAQFAQFDVVAFVARLGRYGAANVFGGLPLYADGIARPVMAVALGSVLIGLIALLVRQWRRIATPSLRLLLFTAATAPSLGLLLLGVAFNTTPIELRYLAYATPFIGLLLAGTCATLPRRAGRIIGGAVLAMQCASLAGLMLRAETMQPARATALAAASLARDGVVLLPRGNDGVGIVGAFGIEAPAAMRLLVVGRGETAMQIRERARIYPRVVLALLGQDDDSRATLPVMQEAFAHPCWHMVGTASHVVAFERTCDAE